MPSTKRFKKKKKRQWERKQFMSQNYSSVLETVYMSLQHLAGSTEILYVKCESEMILEDKFIIS